MLAPGFCSSTDLIPAGLVLVTCCRSLQSDRNSIFSRRWAKEIGSVMLLQSRSNPFHSKLDFPVFPLVYYLQAFLVLKDCVNTSPMALFNRYYRSSSCNLIFFFFFFTPVGKIWFVFPDLRSGSFKPYLVLIFFIFYLELLILCFSPLKWRVAWRQIGSTRRWQPSIGSTISGRWARRNRTQSVAAVTVRIASVSTAKDWRRWFQNGKQSRRLWLTWTTCRPWVTASWTGSLLGRRRLFNLIHICSGSLVQSHNFSLQLRPCGPRLSTGRSGATQRRCTIDAAWLGHFVHTWTTPTVLFR